jgi:hypothetical protein
MRPGIHGTVVPLSRADERYAAAFNDAAQAYALTLEGLAVEPAVGESPTLRVPVEVVTETDPEAWLSRYKTPRSSRPTPWSGASGRQFESAPTCRPLWPKTHPPERSHPP